MRRTAAALVTFVLTIGGLAGTAQASPVCTDGYKGGPPATLCGGRVFPESYLTQAYVQYRPNVTGFREYADGIAYLAQKYPEYVHVFTLSEYFHDKNAVTAGPDGKRAGEKGDTGDGKEIYVIQLTDRRVPAKNKKKLLFSLSVHGNERGGLEGGLRTVEDLAIAAQNGNTTISDGVAGYTSSTGTKPVFHNYSVRDVLKKEDVYLTDFNIDGWTVGDIAQPGLTAPFSRTNGTNTDLNRQMATQGSIDTTRTPLLENETKFGTRFINQLAKSSPGGLMAYGADIHGELTSRAYVDIMYPAGQFNSVKHRQLMSIAERTKSVIDATLYAGIQNQIENQTGGDNGEGVESVVCDFGPAFCEIAGPIKNTIPTKPAHWATVWDTLGYTDTGFIGDYLATDAAVTGMDYEIFLNHTVPDKVWNVYLQENHINASRAIIKTAMAYALFQDKEFAKQKVVTGGQAGYVMDPVHVTNKDGVGTLPGPKKDGIGADGKKVVQKPYDATRMRFFSDTSKLMTRPFMAISSGDISRDPKALDKLDTLVLADNPLPKDDKGRTVNKAAYYRNIASWVKRGGNLVLTDRALHALSGLGLVPASAIKDIKVYQPYTDFKTFKDPMAAGLRANARQLVEAATLGYGIGDTASPMTAVTAAAFKGTVVGTTKGDVTVGRLDVAKGQVQLIGGALPTPSEALDHRFGMRDYALTYSGLYLMENAVRYDAPGLGAKAAAGFVSTMTPGKSSTPGGLASDGSAVTFSAANDELVAAALLLFALLGILRLRQRRVAIA